MEFNDRLDFLMNISQTSNKELAAGISVLESNQLLKGQRKLQKQIPLRIPKVMPVFTSEKKDAARSCSV